MKINIHTPSGLVPISPEVTKQTIIDALGYFPANQAMYSDIEPTDDSTFYIIDKDKNVICKVDADGIHAAIMEVNGKNVEHGLVYDIKEINDEAFYIVDSQQNVLCRIDDEGLTVAQITADLAYIKGAVIASDAILSGESVVGHMSDSDQHITPQERHLWNNKSQLNSIKEDDDTALYINDKNDSTIAKFDGSGLSTTNIQASGVILSAEVITGGNSVSEHINDSTIHINSNERTSWNTVTQKANRAELTSHIQDTNKHFGDELKLDNDSSLCINDRNNNTIAKFGKDGLQTTVVVAGDAILSGNSTVNHINDEVIHITEQERHLWNSKSKLDSISEDDDSTLYINDKNDKTIAKFNADGLTTTLVTSTDVRVSGKSVIEHIQDTDIHIQEGERNKWNTVVTKVDQTTYNTDKSTLQSNIESVQRNIETHKQDTQVHIQEGERDKWNTVNNKVDISTYTQSEQQQNTEIQNLKDTKLDTTIFNAAKITLENAISDLDQTKTEISDFNSHVTNNDIHLGDEITVEDDHALYIADNLGSIIAQFDSEGLNVGDLFINNKHVATEEFVNFIVNNKVTGLFEFKGNIYDHSEIPLTHEVGDVYRIAKAGVYAGNICEQGDMLVCITAGSIENNDDWTILQQNWQAIDGTSELKWGEAVTLATIGGVQIDAKLPTPPDSNVTSSINAGEQNSLTNTSTINPFINHVEGSSVNSTIQLKGNNTASVVSANGVITIDSGVTSGEKDTWNTVNNKLNTSEYNQDKVVLNNTLNTINNEIDTKASQNDLTNHINNPLVHIGDDIKLDNDETLFIVDKEGNIIAKFTDLGFDAKVIKQDGLSVVSKVIINDQIEYPIITEEGVLNIPAQVAPNNGVLTLKVGTNVKTFSANQASSEVFEITKNDLDIADISDIRQKVNTVYAWGNHADKKYLTSEEDPIFRSSAAYTITADNIKTWSEKQDAISDLNTIRAGAALGASALQSVPTEYVTETELTNKGYATVSQVNAKQDKISDLDTIRNNANLGATALQSVPSEYITETELNNKGYAVMTEVNKKVDKVEGKGLSQEDFTTALKTKLTSLTNYDDTTINNAITKLRQDFDALVSGDTTTAIKTFNEVIAFLEDIEDSSDLNSIIAGLEQQIASKQTSSELHKVATSGDYNDLTNKITESTISGWGFTKNPGTVTKITTGAGLTGGTIENEGTIAIDTATYKLPTYAEWETVTGVTGGVIGTVSKVELNMPDQFEVSGTNPITSQGTFNVSLKSGYVIPTTTDKTKWDSAEQNAKDYADSIAYNDTPIKTLINNKYTKPSSGIPSTDLTTDIQTILTNAATAYSWGNHNERGYLTSADLSGYATEKFVTDKNYITIAALTPYLLKTDLPSVYTKEESDAKYVMNVTGKGLSSNDFTDDEKEKLNKVNVNAEVNYIKSVGDNLDVTNGQLTVNLSNYALKTEFNNYAKKTDLDSYATQSYVLSEIAKAALDGSDISVPVEDVKVDGVSVVSDKIANISLNSYAKSDNVYSKGDADNTFVKKSGFTAQENIIESIKVNNSVLTVTNKTVNIDLTAYAKTSDLTNYAKVDQLFSRNYNDLTNLPTIPTTVAELTDAANYALKSEIPSLNGYATESWVTGKGYLTSSNISNLATKEEVEEKQDIIADLQVIREGAAAGATALHADDLTGYATQTWVEGKGYLVDSDIADFITESDVLAKGYVTTAQIPTKVSQLTNDSEYITEDVLDQKNYLVASDIQTKADKSELNNLATKTELNDKANKSDLTGLATEQYVIGAIADAKLEGSDIELPVTDVQLNGTTVVSNGIANLNINVTKIDELDNGFLTLEKSDFYITDSQDNIIVKVDENGLNAGNLLIKGDQVAVINDIPQSVNDLSGIDEYALKSQLLQEGEYLKPDDISELSSVAWSGNYSDLTGTDDVANKTWVQEQNYLTEETDFNTSAASDINPNHIDILNDLEDGQIESSNSTFQIVDESENTIAEINSDGIVTTTLAADIIKISGGTDDFLLLAGGGIAERNELFTKADISNLKFEGSEYEHSHQVVAAGQIEQSGPSISYSDGVLTISTQHIHTFTGSAVTTSIDKIIPNGVIK